MNTESHRVLKFRCAETGRRFIVVFTRQPPATRFTVANVIDEKDFTAQQRSSTDRPVKLLQGSLERTLVPLSSAVVNASKLVQRFLSGENAQSIEKVHSEPEVKSRRQSSPPPPPRPRQEPDEDFNAKDFDFKGWYCPCCGHGKGKPVLHQFIRCGRCHEYVCGARIKATPEGRVYFACSNGCGNRGELGSGTLQSFSGMGLDVQKPALLEDRSKKLLPDSKRTLPPGKTKDK